MTEESTMTEIQPSPPVKRPAIITITELDDNDMLDISVSFVPNVKADEPVPSSAAMAMRMLESIDPSDIEEGFVEEDEE